MPTVTKLKGALPQVPAKKKVAAYARVSRDTEQLMHSLSAQVSYYSNLIQKTPEWDYAGVYVDAGITGTSTKVRPEFQRMLEDCEAGKIDIVLTKSISRFARNTVDLLETVRHLREIGVEVRFEREKINSFSGDGEVMLSILASFAEEESVSLAKNIKWTIQKKYENGNVHTHQKMYGYRWEGDEMVIVPEEAEIVRWMFQSYINGMSTRAITKELNSRGVKPVHAETFPEATVVRMLQNEQYTGCLILHQSYNYRPKKQKLNYGELPMYRVDEHHPAIISAETFAAAQAKKAERGEAARRDPQFQSLFSGMVWCGKCGSKCSWHRSPTSRKNGDFKFVIWTCSNRNNQRGCDCRNIHDSVMTEAAEDILGAENLEENLKRKVAAIRMYDDRLVFEMRTGRKEVWHRK